MTNIKLEFVNSPWLLLLLIPALFLTLFPYFRMAKRYRKTRNRIVSIVLHIIIMVLSISVLAGIKLSYDVPNAENELVILVDTSYSNGDDEARADKANFIYNVVEANGGKSRIAVVKFGYDQQIVLGMGEHTANEVVDRLDFSEDPDVTATDIRAALKFVWNPATKKSSGDLITYPKTAKILVISDGLQTDQDALALARSINADGVRIDTAQFSSRFRDEARIVSVQFPEQNLAVSEEFDIEVTIESDFSDSIVLSATDDDGSEEKEIPSQTLDISRGTQVIKIHYAFNTPGHHEISFHLTGEGDTIRENNAYYAYYDLIEFNKVLIVERYAGESENLNNILSKEVDPNNYFEVNVVRYNDFDNLPMTVEAMRAYDQIVLCNISHGDMDLIEGFETHLNEYVEIHGGGLLTVGGQERDDSNGIIKDENNKTKAHSYNVDDMKGTTYQKMLPVDVINYTPPLAVAIILDQSGSMVSTSVDGKTCLEIAGDAATECVDWLNDRDWVGVMGLKATYSTKLDMTPCTQKNMIRNAITAATQPDQGGGNTLYYPAMERACLALSTLTSVERRHIILISDGQPYDSYEGGETDQNRSWKALFDRYRENFGITISVVSVGSDAWSAEDLDKLCEENGGRHYQVSYDQIKNLPDMMGKEIRLPEVTGVNEEEEFSPTINTRTSITGSDVTQDMLNNITMNGFFGTKPKVSGEVVVPLNAKLVPLYAQWAYGKGMVGSFMCDLNGTWSQEFLDSKDAGVPIINNIVSALMPTTNIRAQALELSDLNEDNYRTEITMRVGDGLESNKKFIAFVQAPAEEGSFDTDPPAKYDFNETLHLSNDKQVGVWENGEYKGGSNYLWFENRRPGIYKITIMKVSKDLNIHSDNYQSPEDIEEYDAILEVYRVVSYSEEYNVFRDATTEGAALLGNLANYGDGTFLNNPFGDQGVNEDPNIHIESVFDGFEAHHIDLDKELWIPFIIVSLLLFLLDVAVRKFKWKWPHEIVRDRKARKAMAKN